jgi:hypothetical protein
VDVKKALAMSSVALPLARAIAASSSRPREDRLGARPALWHSAGPTSMDFDRPLCAAARWMRQHTSPTMGDHPSSAGATGAT